MARHEPTDADRIEALTTLLGGLATGDDVLDLVASLQHLHPKNNTFPGEVFMALGAAALDDAALTAEDPIRYEDLAKTHLPECQFRRDHAAKFRTAVLFSAAQRAGLEPDMFDDVAWWRSDDYWRYAALAAIALIRASARHQDLPDAEVAKRLAHKLEINLT